MWATMTPDRTCSAPTHFHAMRHAQKPRTQNVEPLNLGTPEKMNLRPAISSVVSPARTAHPLRGFFLQKARVEQVCIVGPNPVHPVIPI